MTDEELSLYELAFLLRMPVYKILEEMPYTELLGWQAYLRIRPVGWQEDNRASMIIKALGVTAPATQIFPSLAVIEKGNIKEGSTNIQNSTAFKFMLSAVGGDNPSFLTGSK